MASSRGLIAINNVANSSKQNSFSTFTNMGLNSLIVTGRIISIVLDESHPRFKEFGEWNGLGTIEFDLVDSPTPPNQLYPVAKPLDPSVKSFPLINEIVYILALPNTNIGEFASTKTNYYINTIGIWNHPHHNAFPQNSNILPPSQQKDYVQTQLGSVRRVTDQSTEIFLGRTFVERGNIHPLLPFEGDKILEGRWGNSIRLGSTVKNSPNTWSSTGENGDPITIIRNGQGNQTDEGWIPTIEDINNDDTSIYFTSTQKIPLEASSINDYFSYTNNPPARPNEYAGKQIILNSGRLVFNTTEDHLLLSSIKSINLNAIESINFDTTGPVILQAGEVYLGSKNATEPVLLGQSTINLLQTLLQELATLTNILSLQVGVPPGAPLAPTNTQAALTNATITNLLTQLNGLMSNSVKTV
jgi:hypothetical protein